MTQPYVLRIAVAAASWLLTISLQGCATTAPVFSTASPAADVIENHVLVRERAQGKFEFQSFGSARAFQDSATSAGTESWISVDRFQTANWDVELLGLEKETAFLVDYLSQPPEHPDLFSDASVRAASQTALRTSDHLLDGWLGTPKFKTTIRIHVAAKGTGFVTPRTMWQSGPVQSGAFQLNLAVAIPQTTSGSRDARFHNSGFISQVVRVVSHEFAHLHLRNGAKPRMPLLAEEYLAHTMDRCAAILTAFRFRSQVTNEQILAAGEELLYQPEKLLGRPFATSSTGGELAVASIGAFLLSLPNSAVNAESWLTHLPEYCRGVAEAGPNFSTVGDGIAWAKSMASGKPR